MKFKSIFLIIASAIAGIYLTSPEGKNAREALKKKKSAFEPIIKDLLKQANLLLSGAKEINSEEIKTNVNFLLKSAKKQLLNIDLEKALETIQDAIKVANSKIRKAYNESQTTKKRIIKKKV